MEELCYFSHANSIQNTTFKKKGKKKGKDGCFTCGSAEHWANKCPNKYKKLGQDSKSVNVTMVTLRVHLGTVICLPYFLFVNPQIGGLIQVQIFMGVLMGPFSPLTRSYTTIPS